MKTMCRFKQGSPADKGQLINQQLLVILLGSTGSGKSYFAERLTKKLDGIWIEPESISAQFFGSPFIDSSAQGKYIDEVKKWRTYFALQAGWSVVRDFTYVKRDHRNKLRQLTATSQATTVLVWIDTPEKIAIERRVRRELDDPLILQRHKTQAQRTKTAKRWQSWFKRELELPGRDEDCLKISGLWNFKRQYQVFTDFVDKRRDL